MCKNCYENPLLIDKKCGVCNIPMTNPSRNRVAENIIKNKLIVCKCNDTIRYEDLKKHLKEDCLVSIMDCKYKLLGCKWSGQRRYHDNHTHNGIDLDKLVRKVKKLDKEIEDWMEMYDEVECKHETFKDIILESNITATFNLNDIWNDFRVIQCIQSYGTHPCTEKVLRFCGDNKKGIQMVLYFAIKQAYENSEAKIKCKFEIKTCQRIYIEKELSVYINYIPNNHTEAVYPYDTFRINAQNISLPYYSQWKEIIEIPDENYLEKINDIISNQDCGKIKVFVKI